MEAGLVVVEAACPGLPLGQEETPPLGVSLFKRRLIKSAKVGRGSVISFQQAMELSTCSVKF